MSEKRKGVVVGFSVSFGHFFRLSTISLDGICWGFGFYFYFLFVVVGMRILYKDSWVGLFYLNEI
jgi:hypothetical protein